MIQKTVTYKDFNGTERTETHFFHMSKAECMEFLAEHSTDDGEYSTLVVTLKDLILKSHGEIGPDGRRFVKDEKTTNIFYQTEAYSTIFMELVNDENQANAFIDGIFPADLSDKLNMQKPVLR